MMISPETYIENLKDTSYEELIEERDGLIRAIRKYEKLVKTGKREGDEWYRSPSPDVIYQCNLEYLP